MKRGKTLWFFLPFLATRMIKSLICLALLMLQASVAGVDCQFESQSKLTLRNKRLAIFLRDQGLFQRIDFSFGSSCTAVLFILT